jgi:hypothetical protein
VVDITAVYQALGPGDLPKAIALAAGPNLSLLQHRFAGNDFSTQARVVVCNGILFSLL